MQIKNIYNFLEKINVFVMSPEMFKLVAFVVLITISFYIIQPNLFINYHGQLMTISEIVFILSTIYSLFVIVFVESTIYHNIKLGIVKAGPKTLLTVIVLYISKLKKTCGKGAKIEYKNPNAITQTALITCQE